MLQHQINKLGFLSQKGNHLEDDNKYHGSPFVQRGKTHPSGRGNTVHRQGLGKEVPQKGHEGLGANKGGECGPYLLRLPGYQIANGLAEKASQQRVQRRLVVQEVIKDVQ